jgi:hypothetical protein
LIITVVAPNLDNKSPYFDGFFIVERSGEDLLKDDINVIPKEILLRKGDKIKIHFIAKDDDSPNFEYS